MSYHIFISWSGKRSHLIAQALTSLLEKVFEASLKKRIFISSREIRSGAEWNSKINEALRAAKFGVVCLTPENKSAPWPLFEAGALSKTAGEPSVCPYLHDLTPGDLGRPLEQFNATTTSKEGTLSLLNSINESLGPMAHPTESLKALFGYHWDDFNKLILSVPALDSEASLRASQFQQELPELVSAMRDQSEFADNPLFAHVICDAMLRMKRSLEEIHSCFDVPITLYPAHLASLLEKNGPGIDVSAIAIVDATERFWPQREGDRILKATPSDSNRIFVFSEREHLKANAGWLIRHARRYNVYVASYRRLASLGSEFLKDFSIVSKNSTHLLAYYTETNLVKDSGLPLKMIRFSTESSELTEHQDAFREMLRLATRVTTDENQSVDNVLQPTVRLNIEDEESLEKLADSAFGCATRSFDKRPVEMSSYIDVLEYDLHEEEHAYYCEMMDQMISASDLHLPGISSRRRVLEFGAGTGLFTKRLATIPQLDIIAVELDWACYHILRLRMEAMRNMLEQRGSCFTAENKDCRSFNPAGQFQVIFSSFADHHIFLTDKERYFANVRQNLLPSGLFVVGDEFLPEHDERSPEARQKALKIYHARAGGHDEQRAAFFDGESFGDAADGLVLIGPIHDAGVDAHRFERLAVLPQE